MSGSVPSFTKFFFLIGESLTEEIIEIVDKPKLFFRLLCFCVFPKIYPVLIFRCVPLISCISFPCFNSWIFYLRLVKENCILFIYCCFWLLFTLLFPKESTLLYYLYFVDAKEVDLLCLFYYLWLINEVICFVGSKVYNFGKEAEVFSF